jgi:predicted acylesterase/phospholipase RssA
VSAITPGTLRGGLPGYRQTIAPRPLASCFGGGGAYGIGFNLGVANALLDSGYALDHAPMLGTSAGAWAAACLATGVTFDEVMACWAAHEGRGSPTRVIELTSAVFGDRRDDRVNTMAMHLPSGRRVSLRGGEHSLADIVAASSSPPRLAVPHVIGGRRYIDAGIIRGTSADRARRAEVLVLVVPIATGILGRFGRMSEQLARYEMLRWRGRTRGRVLYVRPDSAVASLISGRDSLFDRDVARRTYEVAYGLGQRRLERFAEGTLHSSARRGAAFRNRSIST